MSQQPPQGPFEPSQQQQQQPQQPPVPPQQAHQQMPTAGQTHQAPPVQAPPAPSVLSTIPGQLWKRTFLLTAIFFGGALVVAGIAAAFGISAVNMAAEFATELDEFLPNGASWVVLTFQLLAMGFMAPLSLGMNILDMDLLGGLGGAGGSVFFVPWLVPAGGIAAVVVTQRFIGGNLRAATTGARFLLAAVSGATFATVVTVLAAVIRFRSHIDAYFTEGSVWAHSASVSGFIVSALLVGFVTYLLLLPQRSVRMQRMMTALATVGEHVAIISVLAGVILAIYLGATGGAEMLLVALFALPNLALAVFSMLHFTPMVMRMNEGFMNTGSAETLTFFDVAPVPVSILGILLMVLVLGVVALRWSLRTRFHAYAGWSWIAILGSYLAVGLLVTFANGIFFNIGAMTERASMSISAAAWGFLLWLVLGAVVLVLAIYVMPRLAYRLPHGLMKVLGVGLELPPTGAAPAPAPQQPASTQPPTNVPVPVPPPIQQPVQEPVVHEEPLPVAEPEAPEPIEHVESEPVEQPVQPVQEQEPADVQPTQVQHQNEVDSYPTDVVSQPVPQDHTAVIPAAVQPAAVPPAAQPVAVPPSGATPPPAVPPMAVPAEPRGPMRRRTKVLLISGVSLVVLAGVAWATHGILARTMFGPQHTAQEYLEAVVDGRAQDALAVMGPNVTDNQRVLATDEIYQAATNRPESFEIGNVTREGSTATVQATLRQEGKDYPLELQLESTGTQAVVFADWALTRGDIAGRAVYLSGPSNLTVNEIETEITPAGQETDAETTDIATLAEDSGQVLLPGTYLFAAPEGSKYLTHGDDLELTIEPGEISETAIEFNQRHTETFEHDVVEAVEKRLQPCLTDGVIRIAECEAASWEDTSWEAMTNIQRDWERAPVIEVVPADYSDRFGSETDLTEYSGPVVARIDEGSIYLNYQVRDDGSQDWRNRTQVIHPFQPTYVQPIELPITLDGDEIVIDDSALNEYNPAWLSPNFQESADNTSSTTCAGDSNLPAGIDSRVCAENLNNATQLSADDGYDQIVSPSGNIACHINGSGNSATLDCVMNEPAVSIGMGTTGPATNRQYSGGGSNPYTLGYGSAATVQDYACVSQKIGMSCWHTESQHGMFLSRDNRVSW